VRRAVAQVLDPASLAYAALLHFEADECGGMSRFVAGASGSTCPASRFSAHSLVEAWGSGFAVTQFVT
jgi:flavorubredoxin